MSLVIQKGTSLRADAMQRLKKNHAAVLGMYLLLLIVLAAVILPFTPLLADPNAQDLLVKNTPPNQQYWFGTDHLGRDIFSRVFYGGRISIAVAVLTTLVAVSIGVIYGAVLVSIAPVGDDTYETTLSLDQHVVRDLRTLYLSQLAARRR